MRFIKEIIEKGPNGLLKERPPARCPYRMPRKKKERLEVLSLPSVPKRLRALLTAVVEARFEMNHLSGPFDDTSNPFRFAMAIEDAAKVLNKRLRHQKRLPKNAIIQYEAGWRFSFTTLKAERLRYKRSSKKPVKKEDPSRPSPGKTWNEPEVGHLCFERIHQCTNCPHFSEVRMQFKSPLK